MMNDSVPRRSAGAAARRGGAGGDVPADRRLCLLRRHLGRRRNNGSGGSDGTRPDSAAMAKWTPNTDFDTCSEDFHDTYYVIGPDGKKYPTWHPPTATDPATGRSARSGTSMAATRAARRCGSRCAATTPTTPTATARSTPVERDASGVPFGYASEQLRAYNAANGIANANRDEDHVGYKIAWENGIVRTRTVNGQVQTFDLSCDALSVLHQETHSADPYASNLHEVLYAIDCSRGADAARFGGKVIVSAMATFGNPGEFTVEQPKGTFTTVRLRDIAAAQLAGRRRRTRARDTDGGQRLRRRARARRPDVGLRGGTDRDLVLGPCAEAHRRHRTRVCRPVVCGGLAIALLQCGHPQRPGADGRALLRRVQHRPAN